MSTAMMRSLSVLWGAVPLLIAWSIFLLVERRDWILNNPVATTIGVLSYSLYLWQQPFTIEPRYSRFAAVLIVAACATASYLLVEKPMLRVGASRQRRKAQAEDQTVSALLSNVRL